MNTSTMRHFLRLGFWLVAIPAWTQQPSPSNGANASPQVITNQDAPNPPLKTSDGVAACPADLKSGSVPNREYRMGNDTLPPKPIETPEAEFSEEARKYARKFMKEHHVKTFEAMSVVRLIVDTNGMAKDICVVREAGHGLDRKAVEAVAEWRFKPAIRDGQPVSVFLTTVINFKLY
jgi:TonB family protein